MLNAFQSLTAVNINAIDFGTAFLPQNQDPTRSAAVTGGGRFRRATCRSCCGRSAATRNIDQQWQDFERTYHSMQFSAIRRFRNGVSFGGNYTLSLSDNGTTNVPLRLQHNADGSFFIREDQAIFNELMKNQGLQRHIFKANFIWDLPDWRTDRRRDGWPRRSSTTGSCPGVFTGGSGARYDITYQYQNNGANVNLTGSPDYAARVVITGDPGSGCSGDRFSQFTTSAFSGPLPGSLGLESGRNYMVGCPDKTTDLAIARNFKLGGARTAQFRVEMYNAFNAVVYNARQTQLQLVSPTNQTIRNPQFLADGSVDPNRLKTTSAGFGAVTGAQALRTIQMQLRFSF